MKSNKVNSDKIKADQTKVTEILLNNPLVENLENSCKFDLGTLSIEESQASTPILNSENKAMYKSQLFFPDSTSIESLSDFSKRASNLNTLLFQSQETIHKRAGSPILYPSQSFKKNYISPPNLQTKKLDISTLDHTPKTKVKTTIISPKRIKKTNKPITSTVLHTSSAAFSPISTKKCQNFEKDLKKSPAETFLNNQTSVSPSSEKVLINKFSKEFFDAFNSFETEVNYSIFVRILKKLNFVLGDEKNIIEEKRLTLNMWENLNFAGKCNKDQLLSYFVAVMRYRPQATSKLEKGQLSSNEAEKNHQKFRLFYSNRTSVTNRSSKNPSFKHFYGFSFSPEINKISKILTNKSSLIERLSVSPSQKTEEKFNSKESECTFKPQINHSYAFLGKETEKQTISKEYKNILSKDKDRSTCLFNLSLALKEKLKVNNELREGKSAEEVNLCTFSPKLKKNKKIENSPKVNGVDKVLKRLDDARKVKKMLGKIEC